MKSCKITLKDGRILYGRISLVDEEGKFILFLEKDQLGMLGTHGTRIEINDIVSCFEEHPTYPGVYEGDNVVEKIYRWRRSWSKR